MSSTLVLLYVLAGIATAIAAFVVSQRASIVTASAGVRVVTSAIAGAVWPIVLVGLAQAAVVVLYVKYAKPRELRVEEYAEPVDARL